MTRLLASVLTCLAVSVAFGVVQTPPSNPAASEPGGVTVKELEELDPEVAKELKQRLARLCEGPAWQDRPTQIGFLRKGLNSNLATGQANFSQRLIPISEIEIPPGSEIRVRIATIGRGTIYLERVGEIPEPAILAGLWKLMDIEPAHRGVAGHVGRNVRSVEHNRGERRSAYAAWNADNCTQWEVFDLQFADKLPAPGYVAFTGAFQDDNGRWLLATVPYSDWLMWGRKDIVDAPDVYLTDCDGFVRISFSSGWRLDVKILLENF